MTPAANVDVFQQALHVLLIMISFILLPALVVGLIISMFQAATQINEMTLSFVPKLLVTIVVLMMGGSWLLRVLVDYSRGLIEGIPFIIG